MIAAFSLDLSCIALHWRYTRIWEGNIAGMGMTKKDIQFHELHIWDGNRMDIKWACTFTFHFYFCLWDWISLDEMIPLPSFSSYPQWFLLCH